MAPPDDLDALSPTELKALVVRLLGKVAALEQTVAAQRAEIARLKGLKGRPVLKPSGMEKASEPKPPGSPKGRRGPVRPRVAVEDQVIGATVPPGSRFKGYADFVIQDLVLRARCIRYRRERWLTPDGQLIVAPLPGGVDGHFGPELRRFVLAQYHQGQVTVPRLVAQLRAIGLAISTRQVMRLLIHGQQHFLDEARDVLRAGLAQAAWTTVDDPGARHKAANGTCTQIGNNHFAWFGTTASKSRLNFLELLRAGHPDYVINAEALAYMRERALSGPVIERLATQHPPDRKSNQQLKDRERAVHDHPPVAVGQDPRQRHDQGTKGRGKHEAKGPDRTFEPHNADDVTDCQGLIDRRSAVFTHAKADAQEQRLPRAFQQVGQRSVIDLVASLQLGELGRLLQTQPDPDRHGDDDDAEQERQAPQPRLGDVIDPQQQDEIDEGSRNGAELDAHEGQRGEEAAPVPRRIFGHQHGRPSLLRAGAEPLQ